VHRSKAIIAPLDWGMGHATRMVPIIELCISLDIKPILCVSGNSGEWLKSEFPNESVYFLPNADIKYGKSFFNVSLAKSLLQFYRNIAKEKAAIDTIIALEKPDFIISDNRYGVYSDRIPSIFITHQSNPRVPIDLTTIEAFKKKIFRNLLRPFSQIWIPDDDRLNISGILSSTDHLSNQKIINIGLLSRFSSVECVNAVDISTGAVVISGPEEQRTMFENALIHRLSSSPSLNGFFVRGTSQSNPNLARLHKGWEIIDIASSKKLISIYQNSHWAISRAGYSSIMDMLSLGKKAILVPTPGQSEQMYLFQHLKNQIPGLSFVEQRMLITFDIEAELNSSPELKKYPYKHDILTSLLINMLDGHA
jgi:UDP-N-acetylglucosamine transferase subunit ALG13